MTKSESIENLAKALCEVQKTKLFALTDKENPFFHSQYADLSSVWSALRKPLTDNGLSIVQTTNLADSGVIIETMLLHESGEYISGQLLMTPEKQTPQGLGSAITYGRRYALASIVGISPEDDDAEKAMDRKKTAPKAENKSVESSEISSAQWQYILKIGKEKSLTENEVISLVKWYAGKENISPRHWKIGKAFLPEENFVKQLNANIDIISARE